MSIGGYGGGTAGENGNVDPYACLMPERECEVTDRYRERIRKRATHARELPGYRPVTRSDLKAAGVTRARIRKFFVNAEHGVFVHVDTLLPEMTATGYRRERRIPAVLLVRAHLLRRVERTATGFAAGLQYGMTHFVEEESLEFLVPNGADTTSAPPHVRLTRTRKLETYRRAALSLDPTCPDHRATDPAPTLARMLMATAEADADRSRRWRIPDLITVRLHLTPTFIRSVQVSDHFHQAWGAVAVGSAGPLVAAGLSAETAAAVLGFTDVGAESPPETLLRLVVGDLAPGLRSQIPVFRENGKLLTTVDLGWEEHGIYLFYDGAHHLQKEQRDHDSEVFAVLQHRGDTVFRVTAGNLKDADKVLELRGGSGRRLTGWVDLTRGLTRGLPSPPPSVRVQCPGVLSGERHSFDTIPGRHAQLQGACPSGGEHLYWVARRALPVSPPG